MIKWKDDGTLTSNNTYTDCLSCKFTFNKLTVAVARDPIWITLSLWDFMVPLNSVIFFETHICGGSIFGFSFAGKTSENTFLLCQPFRLTLKNDTSLIITTVTTSI